MGASIVTIERRREVYREQRAVLTRIADALSTTDTLFSSGAEQLDPAFAVDYAAAESDAERKRVIVDQVASLTDQSAVAWHARLVGDIDPASVGIRLRAVEGRD
jgi:dGTPase